MTENTITFNGKEYDINTLSDKAKYLAGQIEALQNKRKTQQIELDQTEVCLVGFNELLCEELEPEDKK